MDKLQFAGYKWPAACGPRAFQNNPAKTLIFYRKDLFIKRKNQLFPISKANAYEYGLLQ